MYERNTTRAEKEKTMKKFLFVTSNLMPVPAVKGGAVETLLQIVAEENEVEHKAELYILCKNDKIAEKIAKTYKFTHVIYYHSIRELGIKSVFDDITRSYATYRLKNIFCDENKEVANRYAYTALKVAQKYAIDEVIIEGGIYKDYNILIQKYSPEHIYAHFHRVVQANEIPLDVYGNTISVSNYVKKEFEQGIKKREKINNYVLMNCANDKRFGHKVSSTVTDKIKAQLNILKEDFTILFSGRVLPEKGVQELVDAVLSIDNSHIKLIIAGTSLYAGGIETDYMRKIRDKASLSKGRIMCVGFIPNEQLDSYAQIADVWCVPSTYEEPAGLVVVEAMFSGLPIIMSGSGGMREYVNSDCAIIADRKDFVRNLKKAILSLYSDSDLCNQMRLASKVQAQKFTRKNFYHNFMEILGGN